MSPVFIPTSAGPVIQAPPLPVLLCIAVVFIAAILKRFGGQE